MIRRFLNKMENLARKLTDSRWANPRPESFKYAEEFEPTHHVPPYREYDSREPVPTHLHPEVHGYKGKRPKGFRWSDERIRNEIRHELAGNPYIDHSDIGVRVSGGRVYLDGSVPDEEMKKLVQEVCAEVSGVEKVYNDLEIKSSYTGMKKEFKL